jgi:predicted nucleotidyltransferase
MMTIIYKVISGSHSYGTNTPTSDVDIRGVFIPEDSYVFGIMRMDQQISNDNEDRLFYDLRKYIRLLVDCNPNIIELLYVDKRHILEMTPLGAMLRDARNIFLSKRVYYTFGAYAHAQIKRMEGHIRWIQNPPNKPNPITFGALFKDGAHRFPDTQTERAYNAALKNYSNYVTWKANRNPARAELENKFGYDVKHAMHTFRLFSMGIEILQTGNLSVLRPNVEFLRSILSGEFSYKEIKELAGVFNSDLDAALVNSNLPERTDFGKANNLCITIMKKYYEQE